MMDCPIKPLESLLRVVGTGGEEVTFIGYVEVSVAFSPEEISIHNSHTGLLLIVPHSPYNEQVLREI